MKLADLHRQRCRIHSPLIFIALTVGASSALGQVVWTGSDSTLWGTAANWDPQAVPSASVPLTFGGTASNFTVDLDGSNRLATTLTIDSATPYTFTDQGGASFLYSENFTVSSGTGHTFSSDLVLFGGATTTFGIADEADLTISGVIGQFGSSDSTLLKSGDGTLILSAANTYTGTTTISAGTLQLGDGGTTGSIVGNVTNNGTLAFDRSDNVTFGNIISGTGALTQAGTGTLILTADQTFTGTTAIETGGTLQLGNAGGTGIVVGDIVNDGDLVFSRSGSVTYGGVISGTGNLTKRATGTLTLSGDSTFSGATTVIGGTLVVSPNSYDALANSAVTLNSAGTLTMDDDGGGTFTAGSLAGSGTLNLGGNQIDVGRNGTDTVFSGSINFSGSGGALFEKRGLGTLTFLGADIDAVIDVRNGEVVLDGTTGSTSLEIRSGAKLTVENVGAGLDVSSLSNGGETLVTGEATALALAFNMRNFGDLIIAAGAQVAATGSFFQFSGGTTVVDQASLNFGRFSGSNSGTISLSDPTSGGSALTFGRDGTDTSTFADVIEDYTSGSGSVTKVGSNTIRLTGANTYTGGTTITGGTLQLGEGTNTGSLVGDVANSGTLVFNRSDDLTYAGLISGTGSVEQAGTGTTIFTADHTYTGGTTISAGTLQIGDGGTTGSILGDVANAGTLAFNRSDDLTFGGLISGTGALAKDGAGTLTLTGANTYSGDTAINAGTLVIDRADNVTYGGVISGTGGLTKTGTGTLVLSGDSTFSGATTVNAGTLLVSPDSPDALANSSVTINSAGTVTLDDLDGATFALGSLAGSGTLNLVDIDFQVGRNNADTTFSGTITSNSVIVSKYGEGTLTFSGAVLDNGLYIKNGEVVLDSVTGAISGNLLVDGKLTVQNVGTDLGLNSINNRNETLITGAGTDLNFSDYIGNQGQLTLAAGAQVTTTGYFAQTAGDTTVVDQASLSFRYFNSFQNSGTISLSDPTGGGSALTFGRDGTDTSTFAGVIEDYTSGSGSVTKVGTNTITLNGANTYTGGTTIDAGQIVLGNALALQNSTVSIGVNDGLDLNSFDATLGGLAGSGNLALGSQALTVGGNGDETTYAGALSGTGSLNKTGGGILTLTGDNTHSGTTITAGTLQLGDGGATGGVVGDIVNDGTFTINRSDDFTFSGQISGSGDLTKLGDGNLTLGSANAFTGMTTIDEGTIIIGVPNALQRSTVELSRDYSLNLNNKNVTLGALSGTAAITVVSGKTLTVGNNNDNTEFSGNLVGAGNLTKIGSGSFTLNAEQNLSGTTTIADGTIILGTGGALKNSTVSTDITNGLDLNGLDATLGGLTGSGNLALGAQTLAVGRNGASTTYSGILSGSGGLTKEGVGTLALTAAHTFGGDTVIDEGTIYLDGGGADLQNSTVVLNVDGGLVLNDNEYTGYQLGALSGSGDLDTSYLEFHVGGNDASTTYSGNLTGGGFLYKEGGGTWTLTGDALDLPTLDHAGGTLTFDGAGGSIESYIGTDGTALIFRNGAVIDTGSGMTTVDLTVSGSGTAVTAGRLREMIGVRVEDGAQLDVGNLDSSFASSNILVDQGSVTVGKVTNSGSTDSFEISDPTGGTALTFDLATAATYAGTISDHTSGSGSVRKTGNGTLTLTGTNTYTGDTVIDVSNPTALQNTTVVLNADDALVFSQGEGGLGGLSGTGDLNAGFASVYVGGNGEDASYSGNFTGRFLLAKEGGGIWTLQGDMLSLPAFEIHDGAVVFDGAGGTASGVFGTTDESLTFQNGSVLTVTQTLANLALTVTGSGTAITTAATETPASLRVDDGAMLTIGSMYPAPTSMVDGASLTVREITTLVSTDSIQISDPSGGTALTFDNADATTFAGTIADYTNGSGSVLKTGDGALSLSGTNTYTGLTTLSAGTLQTDNLSGSLLQTGGTFAPGNSPATTVIGGDYTQGSSGTLEIELGGTISGTQYDVLNIGGTADLAGNMEVVLIDDFEPTPGESFTILNYAELADNGFSLILPELDGNLEWTVERGSTALTLTFDYTNDLDGFREKYGLNTDGSDDFLDWSGNGIRNVLYLAFGLGDPHEASIDCGRLPAVSGVSAYGDYAVSFVEPSANVGLTLTLATSGDLSIWPDLADLETAYQPVHTETESLDANYERQTLHFDTVPGEDRRFYRMDVEVFDEAAAQ